jgi:hypothetical protein
MVLMTLMASPDESESFVEIMRDLFRNWGDQVAAQEGDGVLVSMWYVSSDPTDSSFAASMMTFEPPSKSPRRPTASASGPPRSAVPETRPVPPKLPDAVKPAPLPVIPVIRTQRPSPTVSETSVALRTPGSSAPDSPHGRNWAELATFMREQRQKGFSEIRPAKDPKNVRFRDTDSVHSLSSGLPTPPLRSSERGSRPTSPGGFMPRPRPQERRPSSPAGLPASRRRFTDDEDWSQRPRRPSPREIAFDGDERSYSPIPRKPGVGVAPGSIRSKSPGGDGRRKYHEGVSPLPFGARGASVKPHLDADENTMPVSRKEQRNETRVDGGERRKNGEVNGVGLGIHGHGVRERAAMI